MELEKTPGRIVFLLAAILGAAAVLLPRVEGIKSSNQPPDAQPVGPFSGWLADGNVLLMSLLLIGFAALVTLLWPARAPRPAVIVGIAPAAWSLILIFMHGDEGFWPIVLAFALGYGGIMAVTGVVLAKFAASLSKARRPR